ncbi:MAG: DUF2127 domain-containing protein [Acidimicrobiales bacterium]
MRLWPKHWHAETWICSIRGHVLPARTVARLRPEDRELGIDTVDGRRLARCLRCDVWVEGMPPAGSDATAEVLAPIDEIAKPRRGHPLSDAILLRLIAINRGVHSVVFGLLALALVVLDRELFNLQSSARGAVDRLDGVADNTGTSGAHDVISRQLHRILSLDKSTITVLALTALAYCVVEGVEAYGLWRERRWAEYLTVVATAGFLPIEIHELAARVTALRVGVLVVNIAVLLWLLWSKHLFGLRGGHATLQQGIDWKAILAPPHDVSSGQATPLA